MEWRHWITSSLLHSVWTTSSIYCISSPEFCANPVGQNRRTEPFSTPSARPKKHSSARVLGPHVPRYYDRSTQGKSASPAPRSLPVTLSIHRGDDRLSPVRTCEPHVQYADIACRHRESRYITCGGTCWRMTPYSSILEVQTNPFSALPLHRPHRCFEVQILGGCIHPEAADWRTNAMLTQTIGGWSRLGRARLHNTHKSRIRWHRPPPSVYDRIRLRFASDG